MLKIYLSSFITRNWGTLSSSFETFVLFVLWPSSWVPQPSHTQASREARSLHTNLSLLCLHSLLLLGVDPAPDTWLCDLLVPWAMQCKVNLSLYIAFLPFTLGVYVLFRDCSSSSIQIVNKKKKFQYRTCTLGCLKKNDNCDLIHMRKVKDPIDNMGEINNEWHTKGEQRKP